ncbi:MAG: tetratricopeptide repeat protein [Anaerolineae bacterium]
MNRPRPSLLIAGLLLLAAPARPQSTGAGSGDLAAEQARIESLADLPSSARVVLVRARNRRQEEKPAEAAQLLAAWLEKNPRTEVALVPFELGVVRLVLDEPEQALESFRAAVSSEPRFGRAWLRLGETAYRLGRFQEAAEAFDRGGSLTVDPPPEILYYAGVAWLQAGKAGTAVDRLLDLLRAAPAPRPLEWYQALVAAAVEAGRSEQAERHLDTLLAERPADPQAWYLAFQLASGLERHRAAAICLTITGYLRPLTRTEWIHLGQLYQVLDVPLSAARCLQKALELAGNPTPADQEQLARTYLAAHRPAEARRILRAALERTPTAPLYSLLGDLEYLQEDFTAALAAYERSCGLDPENGRGWLMQGYCALELGRTDQARRDLERAAQHEAQATSARALLRQLSR